MKLILLSGRADTGKTTILNIVVNMLWPNGKTCFLIPPEEPDNPLCVAGKYNSHIVGIITMGDPTTEAFVQKSINCCLDYNCDIIIGATRTKGQVLNIYKDLAARHNAAILRLNTIEIGHTNNTIINEINHIQATAIIDIIHIIENL